MKENKKFRKDDLSSVDSSKRVYRMYKKKKNWVVAPVLFALLAPTMIAGPGAVIANAVENPATETTVENEVEAKRAEYISKLAEFKEEFNKANGNDDEFNKFNNQLRNSATTPTIESLNEVIYNAYKTIFEFQPEVAKKAYEGLLDEKYFLIDGTIAYGELAAEIDNFDAVIPDNFPETGDFGPESFDKVLADAENAIREYKNNIQRDYIDDVQEKIDEADRVMDFLNDFPAKQQEAVKSIKDLQADVNNVNKDGDYDFFGSEAEKAIAKINNLTLDNNKANIVSVMSHLDLQLRYMEAGHAFVMADSAAKDYADQLDDAYDEEEANQSQEIRDLKEALQTARNELNQNKYDLDNQKYQGDLKDISEDVRGFVQQIEHIKDTEMKDNVNWLTGNELKEQVKNLIDNKDKLEFTEKVKELRADIDAYVKNPNLNDDLKAELRSTAKDIQNRLDKATLVSEVDSLTDEWNGVKAYYDILANDETTTLQDVKDAAVKAVEAYEFLPEDRQGYYIHMIEDFAQTKEAVASYLQQAHNEAVKAESDVKDARKAAKKAIKDLKLKGIISYDQTEDEYLKQIDKATDLAKINDIVEDAETTRDREVAANALQELSILHYFNDEDSVFKQLKAAEDKDDIKEVYNVAIEYHIADKVAKAANAGDARGWAYRGLDAMTYLNENQKDSMRANLKAAKTQRDVHKVFLNIADTNKAMREHEQIANDLQDVKDAAVDEINALEFIDRSMKDAFISEVNAAKTEADIKGDGSQVSYDGSILGRAHAEDDRAKNLFDAKKDAIKAINDLPQLTYKEKTNFGERVANASSKEAVEAIQREAIVLSEGRQIDKASEDKAREIAKEAVKAYHAAGDLNDKQKSGFDKRLDDAKSVKEIKAIYKEVVKAADESADRKVIPTINKHIKASQFASAQKAVDQLRDKDTRAKYQAKLDEAIKVAVAQADAHKVIDSLTTLTDKEKDQAKKDVDKLDKVKEIKDLIEKLLVKEDKVLAKAIEALIKAEDYEAAQAKIAELRSQTEKDRLTAMLEEAMNTAPRLQYQAHVRNKGWMKVGNIKPTDEKATTIGTTGEALPMEAIVVSLNDVNLKKNGIQYRAHVRNLGWQEWTNSGYAAGTTGKALSIENLQFKLTGDVAKKYDIKYRAHVRNLGWQEWVKNGAKSGTTGKGLPIEALQIKLVKKDVAK